MNLAGIAAKFVANKGGEIAAKVLEGADNLFTSKEEKMAMELKIETEVNRRDEAERADVLETLKVELGDMANARAREIAVATDEHTPKINKVITPVLALIIVLSTLLIWAMILFRHYEPKSSESMIIGSLTTICVTTISYYFGSSTGSQSKQKQLDKIQNKN